MTDYIVHNLVQGSPEWHAFRMNYHGASEAAAMLGLSPNMKRTELLHIKKTATPKEFSRYVQERILDRGHELEAMARPLVEEDLGEELYPATCSDGVLSASCDGLTMGGDTAFEHKQWNVELAAMVEAGIVPDTHMPQCQQILLVTGAQRVRFVVSDGTRDRMVFVDVLPDQAWFERIRAGWAQFQKDLDAYTPAEIIEKPEP
ncbi:MAG: YqaJ viral recombinase family protein, partial [Ralstonia mannitolilytica]